MVLVTRRDLKPGYQVVQPAHALAEFAVKYPKIFRNWQINQKNLIVLTVKDEQELLQLYGKSIGQGIKAVSFEEPDIKDQLTAIALAPGELTYKIISSLPLAMKT